MEPTGPALTSVLEEDTAGNHHHLANSSEFVVTGAQGQPRGIVVQMAELAAGSTTSFVKNSSWLSSDVKLQGMAGGRPSSTRVGTDDSDNDVKNISPGTPPILDDDASSLDASYMNAIDPNLLQKQQESNNAEDTNVDEMKIQTMYKMVEDCQVEVEGRDVLKKVLYLTNKQASLIDEQAMERCIQALDIGQPKFIIRLCPSIGVESQNIKAHKEIQGTAMDEFKSLDGDISSELDTGDERIVESQILLFMRTCILPLARQTRALIMVNGANDCYLSAALSEIALAEQARLGKDCPFTVIATCSEDEVHHKAAVEEERESLAGQISRKTATWAKRISQCHRFLVNRGKKLQCCDLTPSASRYIIFEDFDDEDIDSGVTSFNEGPRKQFESVMLQCLTRKLPSIAIQSHMINAGLAHLVELTSRNIPVLLLDTCERAITAQRDFLKDAKPSTRLARESDAFPVVGDDNLRRITVDDDGVNLEGRMELLNIAEDMVKRKWDVQIRNGVVDVLDASLIAFMHSTLQLGARITGSASSGEFHSLYDRIVDMEKLEKTNKDSRKAQVPHELATRAIHFIQTRNTAFQRQALLARVQKWLKRHKPSVDHLIPYAEAVRDELLKECCGITEAGGYLTEDSSGSALDPAQWFDLFDIFTSPNTFSGSVHDVDELKRILGSVAKIDRLPSANSLEALRTLQDAWDHVEVYHQVSRSYKVMAKVAYFLLLSIGMMIVTLVICQFVFGISAKITILSLSIASTFVASYVTFTNPAEKWQKLRMAALTIESHIWTFRTRAGSYRVEQGEDGGYENSAERQLVEAVKEIKTTVLEGADVKNTAFFSRVISQNRHGQHSPTNPALGITNGGPNTLAAANRVAPSSVSRGGVFSKIDDKLRLKPGGIRTLEVEDLESSLSFKKFVLKDGETSSVKLHNIVEWLRRSAGEMEHEVVDSHYEPLQPDAYIRHRVETALAFYKGRIPQCNRVRHVCQLLLVSGTLCSSILAFADTAVWAAVVSIFIASVTAFLEFSGTNGKISRYSFTVHALQELIVWWYTLPPIDRSVVANIDRLVLACEDLLQREQLAWKSTSQTVRMLSKQAEKGAENSVLAPSNNLP